MSPGPLRRLIGALGLVALVPIAWLLATGAITLVDAAIRATATLVVVVLIGRTVGFVLGGLAGSFEREPEGAIDAGVSASAQTERLPQSPQPGQRERQRSGVS